MQNPLFLKQAIIVLREELEYFAIPPKGKAAEAFAFPTVGGGQVPGTDEAGKPNQALLKLKVDCGNALLDRKSIFTALQRNVNRENNVAEQHLIDMLCMRYVPGFRPSLTAYNVHSRVLTRLSRVQRIRARRRLGLPIPRTEPLLHRIDRSCPPQNRNRSPSSLLEFNFGRHRRQRFDDDLGR